tara:strand:+ start:253 stop:774 length:522 start_codon:yes stop_codon:yes gene_type:complete
MSNLRLINETNVTSASQISVTDVFSSDFDIYKIEFDYSFDVTSNVNARLINSSGSVVSASNYDFAYLQTRTDTTFGEGRVTGASLFYYLGSSTAGSSLGGGTVLYVFNPFSSSSYTFLLWQNQSGYSSSLALGYKGISVLKQTSSITGFKLDTTTSNNFTNTNVRTYGLRVDS